MLKKQSGIRQINKVKLITLMMSSTCHIIVKQFSFLYFSLAKGISTLNSCNIKILEYGFKFDLICFCYTNYVQLKIFPDDKITLRIN